MTGPFRKSVLSTGWSMMRSRSALVGRLPSAVRPLANERPAAAVAAALAARKDRRERFIDGVLYSMESESRPLYASPTQFASYPYRKTKAPRCSQEQGCFTAVKIGDFGRSGPPRHVAAYLLFFAARLAFLSALSALCALP